MTARKVFTKLGGFTLVELLIVIALLAIIALIVIAAINPIEQANRARDTGMRSDAAQFLSAVDRYFAVKQEFPWTTDGGAASDEATLGFISVDVSGVGLCLDPGDGSCGDGALLAASELKPEFKNRNFVGATTEDQLMVGKTTGASASVYVCYIPKAKSNRTKAIADVKVYTLDLGNGTATAQNPVPAACDTADEDWVAGLCYVCIPE